MGTIKCMMDESHYPVSQALIANLERLIEARKTNAKKVSLKAKLGETAVTDIIKGRSKSPKLETVRKIAGALDVDIGELIPISEEDWAKRQLSHLNEIREDYREVFEKFVSGLPKKH